MRVAAGRNLEGGRLDFDEIMLREPCPQRRSDATARQQVRPAGGVGTGAPERWGFRHVYLSQRTGEKDWYRARRAVCCAPKPHPPPPINQGSISCRDTLRRSARAISSTLTASSMSSSPLRTFTPARAPRP